MTCYFETFVDSKVKGERHLFVLNHSQMSKLQTFHITNPIGPAGESFPHGHSLFMQCNNFKDGKTHGYLIAIQIGDDWRLGVFQNALIKEKTRKMAYVTVFDEGPTWPMIHKRIKEIRRNGITALLSYMSCVILEDPVIVPLAEVSRRDTFDSKTKHLHLTESGEYFEQPKSPDKFHSLSNKNFEKLFQEPKLSNFDIGLNVREHFFRKQQFNRGQKKNGNNRKRDVASVADSENFDLIKETAKSLKSCKLIDRDDVNESFHVYYVQYLQNEVHEKGTEEKLFLLPVVQSNGSYSENGTITFYNVPSTKENVKQMMECDNMPTDDYNAELSFISHARKTSFLRINPVNHRRGFAFSILPPGYKKKMGTQVFCNEKLIIYHHEQENVPFDSELDGVVVFRGFPWYYDISTLKEENIRFLELMHHTSSGMLDSRKKVDMVGYFSYTGPRASSQSSRSPTEPSLTKGHDIYNKNYCPITYPLGVQLGRQLCRQSDEILEGIGNVMMKASIIAKHHLNIVKCTNMKGHSSQMKYENICHNRIITKCFGSVSHIFSNICSYSYIHTFIVFLSDTSQG